MFSSQCRYSGKVTSEGELSRMKFQGVGLRVREFSNSIEVEVR
jgi:hypothetical protein